MDSMQPLSTPTMSFLVCGATASEKKKNNKKLVKSNKKDTVPKNKTHKHKKGHCIAIAATTFYCN